MPSIPDEISRDEEIEVPLNIQLKPCEIGSSNHESSGSSKKERIKQSSKDHEVFENQKNLTFGKKLSMHGLNTLKSQNKQSFFDNSGVFEFQEYFIGKKYSMHGLKNIKSSIAKSTIQPQNIEECDQIKALTNTYHEVPSRKSTSSPPSPVAPPNSFTKDAIPFHIISKFVDPNKIDLANPTFNFNSLKPMLGMISEHLKLQDHNFTTLVQKVKDTEGIEKIDSI